MKISKKRKVLVSSFIVMLFSMVTFTAATFAWFSDSVSSMNNIIQSGNLDAEMYWSDDINSDTWYNIEDQSNNSVFSHDNYEPGYTDVKYLKIVNAGSLAFKYDLSLLSLGEVGELAEVVDLYYLYDVNSNISSRSLTEMNNLGTINNVLGSSISGTQVLLPKYVHDGTHKADEVIVAVALKMQTSAGNEYQGKSIGDGFSIRLIATQYSFEGDSFGSDFDDAANWPNNGVVGNVVASSPVQPTVDNKVASTVSMENKEGNVNAVVPAGVLLQPGTSQLTLSVNEIEDSKANIQLNENEALLSMDVHIGGVSEDNDVVMEIYMAALLPKGLNLGNYHSYHVEENGTNEMTLLVGDATPIHNSFSYDPLTGDVVLYLKSFSEVSVVADTTVGWEGKYDYSWYNTTDKEFIIANADQLAGFAQIVGGMAEGIELDSFTDKKITLVADINLADDENNNTDKIFHPIGYHYDEESGKPYSTVYSFEGVFDGNGHTIKNFYQNTWEIKGDYDGNYYKDAMGLFGYVLNGEVANLRVENFSSDGEFTPTGVIAAYAENSTFINISLTNCNPRVYNTGNGGIIGIAGDSKDTASAKIILKNITVDNTNKISALWGSWDVACGGLIGMFRGYGLVDMTNCHVAAQIDVYNDVCGNYQYYWYRYAGMIIGSIRGRNITDKDGYTVPDTQGITAENCTVHFGDWNNYYYCELVANSLASYTHDHQFSRLTEIESLDEIKNGETWLTTGNFLLKTKEKNICYHIVKDSDGTLKEHKHEDAGTEVVNGQTVLKEDNQIIFLPFKQIMQGDGWGVKHIPVYDDGKIEFEGIKILDREIAKSDVKFEKNSDRYYFGNGEVVTAGDLFAAINGDFTYKLNTSSILVTVSPVDGSSVRGEFTYDPDKQNWKDATLLLQGSGKAIVTISDYTFCNPTTIEIELVDKIDKFDIKPQDNIDAGTIVKLGDLFGVKQNISLSNIVIVEVITSEKSYELELSSSTWQNYQITLDCIGEITITIKDNTSYCEDVTIKLQAVSINKFEAKEDYQEYVAGSTVKVGDLFDKLVDKYENVNIRVEFENNNALTLDLSSENWMNETIDLNSIGVAVITISDKYSYEATVNVNLKQERRFSIKLPNTDKYLYRVGNNNEIKLDLLFEQMGEIKVYGEVNISVERLITESTMSSEYVPNSIWSNGTVKFNGTGPVKVKIKDELSLETELFLEVVNGENITSATSSNGKDVILLKNVKISSNGTVHYDNCTVYGNGFEFDITGGMNEYNSKQGHGIIITTNAVLDNLVIKGEVYDKYGAYIEQEDYTSAIDATNTIIQNCHISNCSTPVRANGVTIINSTLYGGTIANMIITGGTNTLENVTTVNFNDGRGVIGFGIVISEGAADNAKLVINESLKQYNYVCSSDVSAVPDDTAKLLFNTMFENEFATYHYNVEGKKYVNTAVLSMTDTFDASDITDNRNVKYVGQNVSYASVNGYLYGIPRSVKFEGNVYSESNDGHKASIQGDYLPTFNFSLGSQSVSKENDDDKNFLIGDVNGIKVGYEEGQQPLTLDLDELANVYKYSGSNYDVSVTYVDSKGSMLNDLVTFTVAGNGKLIFSVQDNLFYNQNGELTNCSVTRTYEVPVNVAIFDKAIADATITINQKNLTGEYISSGSNKKYKFYPLQAIESIKDDTNKDGNLESFDFKKNIQSAVITPSGVNAFSAPMTVTITYTSGQVLTITIGTPSGLNSPGSSNGGKTFSVNTDSTNGIYLQSDGAIASSSAVTGTWPIIGWVFKGTSGKEVSSNTQVIVDFTKPSTCVTQDTLITLANGSQVRVDSLTGNEELLVWNHITGSLESTKIGYIVNHDGVSQNILVNKLYFSNGNVVKVIGEHVFFDSTLNKYITINYDNVADYVGHEFVSLNGNELEYITLDSYIIEEEYTQTYEVVTDKHLTCFTEGVLSASAYLDKLLNVFEFNEETLSYDLEQVQADIEKYGLYTYADFEGLIDEKAFEMYNAAYLKVAVGKGYITWDEILELIDIYYNVEVQPLSE